MKRKRKNTILSFLPNDDHRLKLKWIATEITGSISQKEGVKISYFKINIILLALDEKIFIDNRN